MNANLVVIIDKKTGHIVWSLGPDYPARSQQKLPRPVDQIVGQHNPHLIAPGLPGEGNLLLFDNEGEGGYPTAFMQRRTGLAGFRTWGIAARWPALTNGPFASCPT